MRKKRAGFSRRAWSSIVHGAGNRGQSLNLGIFPERHWSFRISVGLYGVMALSVTQRMRELGIRMALGAKRSEVLRLVLGQGATLVGIGLGLGLLRARSLRAAVLASVLYQVGALDGLALFAAMTLLAVIAAIACWLPAQRATRVDPMIALREE